MKNVIDMAEWRNESVEILDDDEAALQERRERIVAALQRLNEYLETLIARAGQRDANMQGISNE